MDFRYAVTALVLASAVMTGGPAKAFRIRPLDATDKSTKSYCEVNPKNCTKSIDWKSTIIGNGLVIGAIVLIPFGWRRLKSVLPLNPAPGEDGYIKPSDRK
jgi:hypothetical protein